MTAIIVTTVTKLCCSLAGLLGEDTEAVQELERLFSLAEAYGFASWLVFDSSVVRGLAYYTGTVFEVCDFNCKLLSLQCMTVYSVVQC